MDKVVGKLSGHGEIVGHLSGNRVIKGSVNIDSLSPYTGEYEATPSWDEQVFGTSGYRMVDDFTVHEIVKQEVSNDAGGLTLSI